MTHTCSSCGFWGWRKRRRDRHFADIALISFHAQLAAEIRAEREAPT